MKYLLLVAMMFSLAACGSSGGGGVPADGAAIAASGDHLAGTYAYTLTNQSGDMYMSYLQIAPGNKVFAVEMVTPRSNHSLIYARKNEGTFIRSGDTYTVTWSYESCDPVGTQTFKITSIDPADRILVTSGNVSLQFLNVAKWYPDTGTANSGLTMIEDVSCNLF